MNEAENTEDKKISIDDFGKIDMRVGHVLSAKRVPETDKLLRLEVDLGEEAPRQIVSGIAAFFENLDELVGRSFIFVVNLEARTIKGLESQGMIMGTGTDPETFALITADRDVPPGTKIH